MYEPIGKIALANAYSIRYYLSERFRLRFEDVGLEETLDETGEIAANAVQALADAAASGDNQNNQPDNQYTRGEVNDVAKPLTGGEIRTLDGEIAGDEFAADAINYQVLLGKIDTLLEKLKLDA